MKKDKFIFYSMAVNMVATFAAILLVPEWLTLYVVSAIMVVTCLAFMKLISIAVDNPIRLFSPIPIHLNEEWCFFYYLTEGSEMISSGEMMHRKLIS